MQITHQQHHIESGIPDRTTPSATHLLVVTGEIGISPLNAPSG